VTQLLKDFEQIESVNAQLEKMGYNIGVRLVDELLARSGVVLGSCHDFQDTAEIIAKVGFKMFLGVAAEVSNWNSDGTACSLLLTDNPMVEFVELPPTLSSLCYANLVCGVIRGALEQVHMKVACHFVRDVVKGDDVNEIRLELLELVREEFVDDDEDG